MAQIEKVEEILEGLESEGCFEHAHKLLGEMVGSDANKVEEEESPDPWWIVGDVCLVFEDHAGAKKQFVHRCEESSSGIVTPRLDVGKRSRQQAG